MNLRQLSIFISVCEHRNMSEAARILFMTQPAISQTISDLENELHLKLFERLNKKLILTYSGEILQSYAKRILSLVDEAKNTLQDLENLQLGKLRIGASTTIGIYLLPKLIGEFRKTHNQIDLPFMIDNTSVMEEKLLENQVDIGLVEGPVYHPDIVTQYLYDDELYLICSPHHPWASRLEIDPKEMQTQELMIREKGSGTRDVFEQTMAACQCNYQIKHVLNNTEAIKKAVEANVGVSVVSKLAIQDELQSGKLKHIRIKGITFKRPLNIIYHKDKYRSTLFQAFVSFIEDQFNHIDIHSSY